MPLRSATSPTKCSPSTRGGWFAWGLDEIGAKSGTARPSARGLPPQQSRACSGSPFRRPSGLPVVLRRLTLGFPRLVAELHPQREDPPWPLRRLRRRPTGGATSTSTVHLGEDVGAVLGASVNEVKALDDSTGQLPYGLGEVRRPAVAGWRRYTRDVAASATVQKVPIHGVGQVPARQIWVATPAVLDAAKLFTYCDQLVTSTGRLTGLPAAKPTKAAVAVPTPSMGFGPASTSWIYTPGDKYSGMAHFLSICRDLPAAHGCRSHPRPRRRPGP